MARPQWQGTLFGPAQDARRADLASAAELVGERRGVGSFSRRTVGSPSGPPVSAPSAAGNHFDPWGHHRRLFVTSRRIDDPWLLVDRRPGHVHRWRRACMNPPGPLLTVGLPIRALLSTVGGPGPGVGLVGAVVPLASASNRCPVGLGPTTGCCRAGSGASVPVARTTLSAFRGWCRVTALEPRDLRLHPRGKRCRSQPRAGVASQSAHEPLV